MTLRPSGDYPDYYPRVVDRLDHWRTVMGRLTRIQLDGKWVRDVPAARLRATDDKKRPKLLAPLGYRFVHNRYTRRYAFPSFYLSDGVTTASAEVFGAAAARRGPLGVPVGGSRLQLVVSAHLPDVIDLTDATIRRRLKVTLAEITRERDPLVVDSQGRPSAYELPQCLGELANELGVGAIRFPSSPAKRGVNIVILTDHLTGTGGWYEVTDPVTGAIERWPEQES